MRKHKLIQRLFVLCLTAVLYTNAVWLYPIQVQAAKDIPLTLDMAKKIGLANSPDYAKLESELAVKEVSLKQAIKSISLKRKNMSTFRWTPLLSFKFPEKPDLTEEYEFEFKPIQIQSEIDVIEHKLTDCVLGVYEEITLLYINIVTEQTKLDFTQERLAAQEEALAKNRVRLKYGEASQNDITVAEKNVESLQSQIATIEGNLVADKKKLSTKLGMDVSTGYSFEDPFIETEIPRSALKDMIQHTLDNDVSYYETSMDATTARISLETNYNLMKSQYGDKMNYISNFVNQALAGNKIEGKVFKQKYEQFLEAIDQPWQGKKKILFIKIPKEWFKGQISGIRYVEDEPYALYEATLEYQDALLEKENAKKSLSEQVESSFNNLVSIRKAYLLAVVSVEDAGKQLKKEDTLNRLGEMTYEEYQDSLDAYEELQNVMLEALSEYAQMLYSFDRLTCGAVMAYLEETDVNLQAGSGGTSYLEEEYAEGAYYYIEPIIQEQEFRIRVVIPDGFEPQITHFELWNGQVQIGERTEIDKSLRHLSISLDGNDEIKLRFYNNETFIDDCIIDADAYSGELQIIKSYEIAQAENTEVGEYTIATNALTGVVTISLSVDDKEIYYYRIKNSNGVFLGDGKQISVDKSFVYLSLIQDSLEQLIIDFYGEDGGLLYSGYFDTKKEKLKKNPEDE